MVSQPSRAAIHPVILSGGVGSRLWPLSRAHYPKQLLALAGELTMLQETAVRVGGKAGFGAPLVVCNAEHRFLVAEQLQHLGQAAEALILEPVGRNTAPAAAAAALYLAARDPEAMLLVLPSDHVIADAEAFRRSIDKAAVAAQAGDLVSFAMAPTAPETGYGYIRQGEALDAAEDCYRVARFIEKPPLAKAQAMLAEGGHYWNGGMFLFTAARYLEELERWRPGIVPAVRLALERASEDLDFLRLEAEAFAAAPSDSIDYAVMEKTERAAMIPVDIGWNDVGAWSALWDIGEKDEAGNVVVGEAVLEDVRDCYVRAEHGTLALAGLRDLIVVATPDAVMAAPRERAQDVKGLVDRLKAAGSNLIQRHVVDYRPWGSVKDVAAGPGFEVKELMVKPGGRLSLQLHRQRAEHWVVVQGEALVTRGEETSRLGPNTSTYIPRGVAHRLENSGKEPLVLIEIRTGESISEADIERFEDAYGRLPEGQAAE